MTNFQQKRPTTARSPLEANKAIIHRKIVRFMTISSLAAAGALAQPTTKTPLTFEVVSIRPSAQGCGSDGRCPTSFVAQPGGGVRITGATLKFLMSFAYNVRLFQISGGPGWTNSDRFDVNARAGDSDATVSLPADPLQITDDQLHSNFAQISERLRNVLADRFRLAIHREAKEHEVYALVVTKNGSKLATAKGGRVGIQTGRGAITGRGVDAAGIASALSDWVGLTVLDKTGLTGNYDFDLKWTPDAGQSSVPSRSPTTVEGTVGRDASGPSIFTALQEQLGLRLESQKGLVNTLVIDYVEHPSEN